MYDLGVVTGWVTCAGPRRYFGVCERYHFLSVAIMVWLSCRSSAFVVVDNVLVPSQFQSQAWGGVDCLKLVIWTL